MSDETRSVAADLAGEDPVEVVLAECLGLAEAEVGPAIARACAAHPDLADDIRERYELLRATGLFVESADEGRADRGFPDRLGPFRLIRRLGGGGMGVVYLAEQEPLHREVALKLIRPEHLFFPGARRRFTREVEAVARLQHPGIVSIYTFGEADGVPYFAMERIVGGTVAEVLDELQGRDPVELTGADFAAVLARRAGKPLASDRLHPLFAGDWASCCVRIAKCVAQALEHAHGRGVYHRDVKPSNIAVTPDGRVLLLDFGLARSEGADRLTRSGSTLGSVHYMPPEVIREDGVRIERLGDVYSLGVTLYEMLTLRAPFDAESAESLRQQIVDSRAPAMGTLNTAVPWDLETVCLTAMDRDPLRRYASAHAFVTDLENLEARRPIVAQRPSLALRARRWTQRHPTWTAAGILGGALFVLTPLALLWQEHRHSQALQGKVHQLEEANFELERAGYESSLMAAATLLDSNQIPSARRLLDQTNERWRGWEWGHLRLRADCSTATIQAHVPGEGVTAIVLDETTDRIVTASEDGSVRTWALSDLEPVGALSGHRAGVGSLCSIPGGGRIASAGDDGQVIVWDLVTERPVQTFVVEGAQFRRVAVSLDGSRIAASGGSGHLRVWSLDDARQIAKLDKPANNLSSDDQSYALAFAPDGRLVCGWTRDIRIHVGNSRVEVYDLDAGTSRESEVWEGAVVTGIAVGPQSERVYASGSDSQFAIWKLDALGAPEVIDSHDGRANTVAMEPSGKRVATASSDLRIRFWMPDGEYSETLLGHDNHVWALAFSGDGRRLYSGAADGELKVWDLDGPRAGHHRTQAGASIQSVAFSPDGTTFATGGWRHRLWIHDVDGGADPRLFQGHSGTINAIAYAADGRTVYSAAADETLRAWDVASGRELWVCELGTALTALAVHQSRGELLVGDAGGVAHVVSRADGARTRQYDLHEARIWSLAIDPAGVQVLSGAADGVLRLCEYATGEVAFALPAHAKEVRAVGFSPDGRWMASGSTDCEVWLWDRSDLAAGPRVLRGHESKVLGLAFGADSQRLFSISPRGFTMKVWHVETGTLLSTVVLRGVALCLAVHPDGELIATGMMRQGGGHSTVSLWRGGR